MRLTTSTSSFASTVLTLLSLSQSQFGTALPFFHRRSTPLRALLPRATYSVVAVDSGPAPTEGAQEVTVTRTAVQTIPPKTKTLTRTDSVVLPDTTIVTTSTLESPKSTQTLVVTVTPSVAATTETKYSVIDVYPTTSTANTASESTSASTLQPAIQTPAAPVAVVSPQTSLTTTSPIPAPTQTPSTTSAIFSSYPILDPAAASSSSSSSHVTTTTSSTLSITSSASNTALVTSSPSPSSTSSQTFDDGQWKTYYPTWSNSTRTATSAISSVQPTSSVVRLSALPVATPGPSSQEGDMSTLPSPSPEVLDTRNRHLENGFMRRSEPLKNSEPWFTRPNRKGGA